MSEKYIRKGKNSYALVKDSRVFGNFASLEDAIFVRDILVDNNFDIDNFTLEMYLSLDSYVAVSKIDEKLHILGKFKDKPNDKLVEKLIRKRKRNPNNSKYGLNIIRVFDLFMVKKQIAGDEYIFAVSDTLEEVVFVRNFLLDNKWNVGAFLEIEYDDEAENYKIVEVIDDRAYVLDSFKTEKEAQMNLENSKKEFLNRIYRHKHGLANHPHLDSLTGELDNLQVRFDVEVGDDVWNFGDVSDPLSEIIFNMTPWQKIVYDAIDGEVTIDDLCRKLSRYRSKNFPKKIEKNLDELVDLKMVEKLDSNYYKKI